MISTFNLSKLEDLLRDFYTLTKIRITVFDENFNELVSYPKEISTFCQVIRSDSFAKSQCLKCDKEAFKYTAEHRELYLYKCHAGLTECVAPIQINTLLIGYLFFGHAFAYKSHIEGWEKIKELCKPYQIDMDSLKNACYDRPIISDDYITSASHILHAVASYLCLEQMAILRHNELPAQIDHYITTHFTQNLNVDTLCEQFNIGKTQLYRISKQNYGKGIAEHIRLLRINKAKQLLISNPDLRVSEIAEKCGFNSDYNYFITMFNRIVGMPPKAYRQMHSAEHSSKKE